MRIQPQFACYELATRYGHRILFIPPYRSEVQSIDKVWAMIKNPMAYNSDPQEPTSSLREKLVNSLLSLQEELFLSVWIKTADNCMVYCYEFHTVNATIDLDEEDQDVEMDSI